MCYIDGDAQGGQGRDQTACAQSNQAQNGNTNKPRGEASPRKHVGEKRNTIIMQRVILQCSILGVSSSTYILEARRVKPLSVDMETRFSCISTASYIIVAASCIIVTREAGRKRSTRRLGTSKCVASTRAQKKKISNADPKHQSMDEPVLH